MLHPRGTKVTGTAVGSLKQILPSLIHKLAEAVGFGKGRPIRLGCSPAEGTDTPGVCLCVSVTLQGGSSVGVAMWHGLECRLPNPRKGIDLGRHPVRANAKRIWQCGMECILDHGCRYGRSACPSCLREKRRAGN